jgi:hypothetical protein
LAAWNRNAVFAMANGVPTVVEAPAKKGDGSAILGMVAIATIIGLVVWGIEKSLECKPVGIGWDLLTPKHWLGDGDSITVQKTSAATDAGKACFQLRLSGDVTWYKEIQVVGANGQIFEKAIAEGKNASSGRVCLTAGSGSDVQMLIIKAKLLGVHTCMYRLGDLSGLQSGGVYDFVWSQD